MLALRLFRAVLGFVVYASAGTRCVHWSDDTHAIATDGSTSFSCEAVGDKEECGFSTGQEQRILSLLDEAYQGYAGNAAWNGLDEVPRGVLGLGAELTYGEVSSSSVVDLLRCVGARPNDRFYDLGSGTGKAVAVAALMGLNATGVELVPSRCHAAIGAAERLSARVADDGNYLDFIPPRNVCASFLEVDFSDADIVLLNSLLFPEEVLDGLAKPASLMRPGAWIVSSKTLLGSHFETVGKLAAKVSWSLELTNLTLQQVVR